MRRTGKFTLADLTGAALIVTIFAAAFPAIMDAVAVAWQDANLLVKATIAIIPVGILFAIVGSILASGDPEQLPERAPARRRRAAQ